MSRNCENKRFAVVESDHRKRREKHLLKTAIMRALHSPKRSLSSRVIYLRFYTVTEFLLSIKYCRISQIKLNNDG